MSYEELGYDYEEDDCFEDGVKFDVWSCVTCKKDFVDPEDYPLVSTEAAVADGAAGIEPRIYWLGMNEPVCSDCAAKAGIPPVDEGDE